MCHLPSVQWKRVAWWSLLFYLVYTAPTESSGWKVHLDVYPRISACFVRPCYKRVLMEINGTKFICLGCEGEFVKKEHYCPICLCGEKHYDFCRNCRKAILDDFERQMQKQLPNPKLNIEGETHGQD